MFKTIFPVSAKERTGASFVAETLTQCANKSTLRSGAQGPGLCNRAGAGILLGLLVGLAAPAATYYANPSGSLGSGNGSSAANAMSLSSAVHGSAPAGSTVIVLNGTYSGELDIEASSITLVAANRWQVICTGSGASGIIFYTEGGGGTPVHDVTVDGFQVSYSAHHGFDTYGGNNNKVRNCWVHHTGRSSNQSGAGVHLSSATSANPSGQVIEGNLIENCGGTPNYDHGIYAGGTGMIIRNNVVRKNIAYGIQVWNNNGAINSAQVYNNLCYGNNTANDSRVHGSAAILYGEGSSASITAYGNTFISSDSYCIQAGDGGTFTLNNNIFVTPGTAIDNVGASSLSQGHNYSASSVGAVGFVNSSSGLYWLSTSSPARNQALASACGAVDFCGSSQTSVADVGAFQYSAAYAADTRVLDPSPSGGANYWQYLGGGSTPSTNSTGGGSTTNSTGGGSTTNSTGGGSTTSGGGFSFQASAGVLTAPFVSANGYVSQTVDTESANGGQAVYSFTTTTAGVYVVSAVVNAPNTSQNSFYVNIDAPQIDPYTIWDIPVTSGFESRTVSWRGNGIGENDEFAPKAFALPAGTHSLTIMGREPNVQLQSIQITSTNLTAPAAAPVLRLVPGP